MPLDRIAGTGESEPNFSQLSYIDTDQTQFVDHQMPNSDTRKSYKQIVVSKSRPSVKINQTKQQFKKTLSAKNLNSTRLIQDNRSKIKQMQSPIRALESKSIFSGFAEIAVERLREMAKIGT